MYRFACTGSTITGRIITCYVAARDRNHAIDLAFDDMGIVCLSNVRKSGGSRLK